MSAVVSRTSAVLERDCAGVMRLDVSTFPVLMIEFGFWLLRPSSSCLTPESRASEMLPAVDVVDGVGAVAVVVAVAVAADIVSSFLCFLLSSLAQ